MMFVFGFVLTIYYFPGIEFDIGPSRPDPKLDRWLAWTCTFMPFCFLWLFIIAPIWASRDKPRGAPASVDRRFVIPRTLVWIPVACWFTPCAGCMCFLPIVDGGEVDMELSGWAIWIGGCWFWIGMAWLATEIIQRRKLRIDEGEKRCRQCGFDLTLMPDRGHGICPECDSPFRGPYQDVPMTFVDSNWPRWTLEPSVWRYWSYAIVVVGLLIIGCQPELWRDLPVTMTPMLSQARWAMLVTAYAMVAGLWFTTVRYWLKLNAWQRQNYRPTPRQITNWAEQSLYAFVLWVLLFVMWAGCLSPALREPNFGEQQPTTGGWETNLFIGTMIAMFAWNLLLIFQLNKRIQFHCHAQGLCYHCGFALAPRQRGRCPKCKTIIPNASSNSDPSQDNTSQDYAADVK